MKRGKRSGALAEHWWSTGGTLVEHSKEANGGVKLVLDDGPSGCEA